MKKRFVTLLLVLTMALSLLPGTAWADVYQGDFASGTSYSYDTDTQTLTISGKGVIPSNDSDSSPYATCGFPISDAMLLSIPIYFLFNDVAAIPVVPEPLNGSKITSPSLVQHSIILLRR